LNVEDAATAEGDFKNYINPDSLQIIKNAKAEPSLGKAIMGGKYQFLRKGYFCADKSSTPANLIFNRTVSLKDTWAREVQKTGKSVD
jgi:glutaminyl-tRNA synthetase